METRKQLERLNRTKKPGSSPALKSLIVVRHFNNNQIINNAKLYLHSAISSCSIELNKMLSLNVGLNYDNESLVRIV